MLVQPVPHRDHRFAERRRPGTARAPVRRSRWRTPVIRRVEAEADDLGITLDVELHAREPVVTEVGDLRQRLEARTARAPARWRSP